MKTNQEKLIDEIRNGKKDLQGANLRNADLEGADLKGADLRNADLRFANLRNANLQTADLQDAKTAYCTVNFSSKEKKQAIQFTEGVDKE